MEISDIQTAAVFGASGGIGSALCEALGQAGVQVFAGSRNPTTFASPNVRSFTFDFENEASLADAATMLRDTPPQLVLVTTGALTLADGAGPERSLRKLDAATMSEVFRINTIGPALIAKHILPVLPRNIPHVFACLSARVGSISENGLGGWHSYRASKAALNMLIKNFAIETARTNPQSVIVGLHPGTVDTALSEPFQSGLPEGQLTTPPAAANNLLSVVAGLTPQDSGKVFDWKGEEIPA